MERGDRAGRSGAAVEKEGGSGIFRPVYEWEAGAAGIVPGRHVSAEFVEKAVNRREKHLNSKFAAV